MNSGALAEAFHYPPDRQSAPVQRVRQGLQSQRPLDEAHSLSPGQKSETRDSSAAAAAATMSKRRKQFHHESEHIGSPSLRNSL